MADTLSPEHDRLVIERMPIGSVDRRTAGWWGVAMLIVTEAFLFAYLLFSYYYFAIEKGRAWLPAQLPEFRLSGPNTAILILSSVVLWFGERRLRRRGSRPWLIACLAGAIVLGVVFVGIQLMEWRGKPFGPASHSYGSLYFTITGFHMAHVVVGLVMLAVLTLWAALGYFDRERMSAVSIGSIYWHFVDAVWLMVFFTFYVTPHLFWP